MFSACILKCCKKKKRVHASQSITGLKHLLLNHFVFRIKLNLSSVLPPNQDILIIVLQLKKVFIFFQGCPDGPEYQYEYPPL